MGLGPGLVGTQTDGYRKAKGCSKVCRQHFSSRVVRGSGRRCSSSRVTRSSQGEHNKGLNPVLLSAVAAREGGGGGGVVRGPEEKGMHREERTVCTTRQDPEELTQ